MLKEHSWDQFRNSGMLWCANRILHLFGWVIVLEVDNKKNLKTTRAYPARTRFRGFTPEGDDRGFKNVSKFMKKNAAKLLEECD